MRKTSRGPSAAVSLFSLLVALSACGGEFSPSVPDEPGGGGPGDLEDEEREKNARIAQGATIEISGQTISSLDLHAVQIAGDVILNDCFVKLRQDPGGDVFIYNGAPRAGCTAANMSPNGTVDGVTRFNSIVATCEQTMCQAEASLCVAHRLLELSAAVGPTEYEALLDPNRLNPNYAGDPTKYIRGNTVAKVTIPPPDAESAAALRETAFHYAAWAANLSGENLRKGAGRPAAEYWGRCTATDLTGKTIDGIPYGEAFASMLTESIVVAGEAVDGAVGTTVAVAEADYARVPDQSLASKMAWSHGTMSRARAAHLLIGGGLGQGLGDYRGPGDLESVTAASSQAFCPSAALVGKDAEALEILRLAAPHPAVIASPTITFTQMFQNNMAIPGGGGNDVALRQRLAQRTGDLSLNTMSAATFLQKRRLSEANFVAARNYIANEVKAFVRDQNAVLPPVLTSTSTAGAPQYTTAPLYAATGTDPLPPPTIHYQTMARFPYATTDVTNYMNYEKDAVAYAGQPAVANVQSWANYSATSLVALTDYGRMVSGELLTAGSGLGTPVQTLLGSYLGGEGGRVTGRLESCYRYYTPAGGTARDELRIRIYGSGQSSAADYLLVVGASGLRCAVEGSVEGAPCTLSSYAVGATGIGGTVLSGPTLTTTISDPRITFPSFVQWEIIPPIANPPLPIYVVRKRDGALSATPGNYKIVTGLRPQVDRGISGDVYHVCSLLPLHEEIYAGAQAVLTPTPESCGQAALTCAGTAVADKIPLESELSDDGNGIESSWRVYLDRARVAAQHADQLGEQLLEAGLDIDRRIEGSIEELSRLCGADVSLADFFPANMSGVLGSTCPAANEGQACVGGTGQVCRSGRCVADPLKILEAKAATDPAAARLVACLGGAALVNVALGSKPMCLYRNKTTGRYCESIDGVDCPYAAETNGTCASLGLDPATYQIIGPTQKLDLFSPPEPGSEEEADVPPACSAVRRLRQGGISQAQRGKDIAALNTGFFAPQNVRAYAARIGWEARPLDYSAITLDGSAVFETGSIFNNPHASSKWPCTAGAYPGREGASAVACPAPSGATEDEASLFCSYTTCDAALDPTARARMNHRMARAVLALRVLSGAGLGPAFRGPFKPVPEWILYEYLDDPGSNPDLQSYENVWTSASSTVNGHLVSTASSAGYRVVDGDWGSDDDVKVLDVTGLALCFSNAPTRLWTTIEGAITGTGVPYDSSCSMSPMWMPMFKAYPASEGENPGPLVAQIWMGLDSLQAPAQPAGFEGLVRRMVYSPGNPDTIVLTPTDPRTTQLTSYWDDEAPYQQYYEGQLVRFYEMNPLQIAQEGLRERDVLDVLELMCEVARVDTPGLLEGDCDPAVVPTSLTDVESVERYLRCVGNEIRRRAEREVFVDMPGIVVDALKPGFQLEGELEAAAGEFAAALMSFSHQEQIIGSVLASFAEDVRRLRIQLRQQGIASELVELNKLSAIANQTAACMSAAAETIGVQGWSQLGAVAVCANSAAQIGYALESASLEQQNIELEGELRWIDYQTKFRGYAETLREASDQLTADGAAMRAALARIHAQREKGLRELTKAMMMGTDAAGRHFAVNTVIRRRYNTLSVRYQRAVENARKLAWIARRAIEQRLGIHLGDLHDDLLLVESPARWADELCTITGIDYTRIRAENGLDADDYADQYLGDYVEKLGMVVASYEHDFPFHEGQDTAVISLRDDVSLARRTCEVSANNLLAYSARLDVAYDPETYAGYSYDANPDGTVPAPPPGMGPAPVWQVSGCSPALGCASIVPLDATVPANRPVDASLTGGDVPAYRVTFSVSGNTNIQRLTQRVHLTPGYYRLSWYGRYGNQSSLGVLKPVQTDPPTGSFAQSQPVGNDWFRMSITYKVVKEDDYDVGVRSNPIANFTPGYIDFAGLMLEDVTALHPGNPPPGTTHAGPYVATTQPGVTLAAVCEDTHGEVFHTRWRRGCERLCPAGFGTCDSGPEQCFWEMSFDLPLEGIEGGQLLKQAGFAYGNYNYRIGGIAVNIVGTGVKDCSQSPLPTTCQANASVPYSLAHIGPYTVRNHRGDTYQAPLYEANIEHARALAAERYLTNPISAADRSLIDGYEHHELRGRPLTGRYRLRIWDQEGVAFDRIEDVQVILDYHYWTRFE